MIFLCGCGRRKSGQPFDSAMTKAWMCAKCQELALQCKRSLVDKTVALKAKLDSVCSPMAGDKRLKISTVRVRVPPDAPFKQRRRTYG